MDTNTQPATEQTTILSWTAPERPGHGRDIRWYLIAGGLTFGLSTYAVLAQSWSFLMVLIVLALTYALKHKSSQSNHEVTLREGGVQWDKTFVPWSQCEGYWMLQGPGYVEIHIETIMPGYRHLIVQTGPYPPDQISNVLSQLTPPLHDRKETMLDTIIRICKL